MSTPEKTLIDYRPAGGDTDPDAVMMGFLEAMVDRGIEPYPAQEEAILELFAGKHVILNTPTGSGKSLVALALHFKALAEGKRCYYTSPIKALVSEKFFSLCDDLGAENVGMMTGDASINKDAPIICCTAEILSNIALREGRRAIVHYVVMDEFHYFSDRDRGTAWQVPLLTLPKTRFLLMSATLGDMSAITALLEKETGVEVAHVKSNDRPVPLDFTYALDPIHETIAKLIDTRKSPVYVVNFTQNACAEQAQNLMSVNFCDKEHKERIKEAVGSFRFDTAYGKDMKRYILHGLGLHHAGLLPKYRLLVEQLSQQGLLKVISGTDTLGVGVNIPIRTVLFTQLCKFDGEKTGILSVRDFKQISGRAGRKGFDDAGSVVCQAPEHVIENLRMEARLSGDDPATVKKRKKWVKKKPPEKGYVHFDEETFKRLQTSEPEPLTSRFEVTHGMMMNLLQGHENGYRELIGLIDKSLEPPKSKPAHRRRSAELFRSLRGASLVDVKRRSSGKGSFVDVAADLQLDFSLNHTLSLFLVEALSLIDPESETFALDVLSLVESILENPRVILMKQLDRLRGDKVAELKAAGVEYDQRMEELEKLEHPKPNADFIYGAFNAFAKEHPWVGAENIRPKSICRDMVERYLSFHDYIKEYGLQRSEGLLLRHVSQTYRTLVQSVPERFRDDQVLDIIAFFRTMLARVDTSLIEEWESMLAGGLEPATGDDVEHERPLDLTRDKRAFRAQLRAELHALVKALAEKDYEGATSMVRHHDEEPWTEKRFEEALASFYERYERLVFDHTARFVDKTIVEEKDAGHFAVRQILVDPEGENDWVLEGTVSLAGWSPEQPLVRLDRIGA